MSDSSQKFIARNRAPRVQIEYDVELYGSEKKVQLPFVTGVMSDLAGKSHVPQPAIADRKFLEIDVDNFDDRMKAMAPRVAFTVPNTLTGDGNMAVDLTFEKLDDFSPTAIASKVDALRPLLEARTQLSNLMAYMDGKSGAETLIEKILADPTLLKALSGATGDASDHAAALDSLRGMTPGPDTKDQTADTVLGDLKASAPVGEARQDTSAATLNALRAAAPETPPETPPEPEPGPSSVLDSLKDSTPTTAESEDTTTSALDALRAATPEPAPDRDTSADILDGLKDNAPDVLAPQETSNALDALRDQTPEPEPEAEDTSADIFKDLTETAATAPDSEEDPLAALDALAASAPAMTEDADQADDTLASLKSEAQLAPKAPDEPDTASAALDALRAETPATAPPDRDAAPDDDILADLLGDDLPEPEPAPDTDPLDDILGDLAASPENDPDPVDAQPDVLADLAATPPAPAGAPDPLDDILGDLTSDDPSDDLDGLLADSDSSDDLNDLLGDLGDTDDLDDLLTDPEPAPSSDDVVTEMGSTPDDLADRTQDISDSVPEQDDLLAETPEPAPTPPKDDLDDLLGDFGTDTDAVDDLLAETTEPAPTPPTDDLDDLLGDLGTDTDADAVDDLLDETPEPAPTPPTDDLDDLLGDLGTDTDAVDDLLDETPEPAPPAPTDDLDDLLGDLGTDTDAVDDLLDETPEPAPTPPKDDLDDLLGDLGTDTDAVDDLLDETPEPAPTPPTDDLDDLLGDLGTDTDDLDDLLGDLSDDNATAQPDLSNTDPEFAFGTITADRPSAERLNRKRFRLALFGDFSGRAARGLIETGDALAARKAILLDPDTVDDVIAGFATDLILPIGQDGGIEVKLGSLDDLHPDELYETLPIFAELVGLRQQLASGSTAENAARQLRDWGEKHGTPVAPPRRTSAGNTLRADLKLSAFQQLIGDTSAQLTQASPLDEMIAQIVGPHIRAVPDADTQAMIAAVDQALSAAMRLVLHHPEFQQIEAQWRSIDLIARQVEADDTLDVMLYDVSAEEIAADLASADDLSQSGFIRLLTEDPLDEENGRGGFSALIGLYTFEETPPHAELLGRISRAAAHVDAPFIAGITPAFLETAKKDRHPLTATAWDTLRAMPEAGHLALASPRFLLRRPYGAKSEPIYEFEFEEFTEAEGLRGMLWANPVVLVAILLAKSFKKNGPSMGLGSVMSLGEMPYHYVTDRFGDQVALPCTERNVTESKLEAFTTRGILPVVSIKGRDEIRLASFRALSGDELRGPWSGVAPPEPSPPKPPAPQPDAEAPTDVEADLDDLLAGFDDADAAGDDSGDIDADLAALLDDL